MMSSVKMSRFTLFLLIVSSCWIHVTCQTIHKVSETESPNAPDGGTRHGGEQQLTATITTILQQSASFLDRQCLTGISNHGFPYTFTEPSLYKYGPSQWLWDSSSAVITNSHRNITRAVNEFKTLMKQQAEDGRIAETAEWPVESVNEMTQMPVIPWALRQIYTVTNDTELLKTYVPQLIKYWEWWSNTRDIDGNGLVTVIHPWETGIDVSPAFDAAWHIGNLSSNSWIAWLELYPLLAELQFVYKEFYKWNTTEILARKTAEPSLLANWFMVQDVGINALYAAGWTLIGDLAAVYDGNLASQCRQRGQSAEQAMYKYMWNSELKQFVTLYRDRDGSNKWSSEQGVQSLFPLLLSNLTAEMKSALLADAADPKKFWTEYPFPSVSLSSPAYTGIYTVNLMWRGPTWGFTNWFVLEGLTRMGKHDMVYEAVSRWITALQIGGGIWEMWNAQTGIGYGAEGLGMSSLIVDWLYRTNRVTPKHLPTPPTSPVDVSKFIGTAGLTDASFDDGWLWVNATGSNAVIDAIAIQACENNACIATMEITYGDRRFAQFATESTYTSQHGATNFMNATAIDRNVDITRISACTETTLFTTLVGLSFVLSNGNIITAGETGGSGVSCTWLASPGYRIVGLRGYNSTTAVTSFGTVAYH